MSSQSDTGYLNTTKEAKIMSIIALQKVELINRLEQLAIDYNISPENLLDRAVKEFVEKMEQQIAPSAPKQPQVTSEFLQEIEAFERLKPELLKQYRGRAVAIYQGEVVASGDDILSTHQSALDELGEISCYVGGLKNRHLAKSA